MGIPLDTDYMRQERHYLCDECGTTYIAPRKNRCPTKACRAVMMHQVFVAKAFVLQGFGLILVKAEKKS